MCSKSVFITLCTAAIAFTATPAAAYEPQSNTVDKEKQAERKICRWLPVTGSNMNQKVCLTAEDWKKAEALSW